MVFAEATPKSKHDLVKTVKVGKVFRHERSDCHVAVQEAIQELLLELPLP